MNTLTQICKQTVTDAIDHDYLEGCGTLKEVFMSEYGAFRMNISPKECMDYLMGLTSVCTVPFANSEILELLAAEGISRKSEDGQANLIEKYWQECGNTFYSLVK